MDIKVGDTVVNTVGLYARSSLGVVTPDFGASCSGYITSYQTWTVTGVAESSPEYPGQRILECYSQVWGDYQIPESALQTKKG